MITSLLNPALLYVAVILGGLGAYGLWLHKHDVRLEAEEIAKINAQGNELAKAAEDARAAADAPGSLQRLRASWCRDC